MYIDVVIQFNNKNKQELVFHFLRLFFFLNRPQHNKQKLFLTRESRTDDDMTVTNALYQLTQTIFFSWWTQISTCIKIFLLTTFFINKPEMISFST